MSTLTLTGAGGRLTASVRPALRELFEEVRLFDREPVSKRCLRCRRLQGW